MKCKECEDCYAYHGDMFAIISRISSLNWSWKFCDSPRLCQQETERSTFPFPQSSTGPSWQNETVHHNRAVATTSVYAAAAGWCRHGSCWHQPQPHGGRGHASRFSQGWVKHWAAVARVSGSNSSIGMRKSEKSLASLGSHSYFSTSTSCSPQGFSLVMCRSSPGHTHHTPTLTSPSFSQWPCKQNSNSVNPLPLLGHTQTKHQLS